MVPLPDTQQALVLLPVAIAIIAAIQLMALNARMLSVFAPEVALVVAAALLLCLPVALRAGAWMRRFFGRSRINPPP